MVILLGRTGSVVAAGIHIMLPSAGLVEKPPFGARACRGPLRLRMAGRVSRVGVGQTDRVMLR
jgi:hypothetical protein